MAGGESVAGVRSYYEQILPFYELEAVSRAHLAFWSGLAKRWRPRRILEVGAGLGRITEALGQKAPAVGIDISIEMLTRAQSQRRRGSGASFVAADMRRFAFARPFDLIVAPSDPFSHLTSISDRRRALSAVARHLSPSGHFVLEGLHRRRRDTELEPRRIRHAGGFLRIEEAWYPVGIAERWHARYRYTDFVSGRPGRTLSASFVARAWNPAQIRRLFRSCGLAIESMWGDFDRRPFASGAPRLVVVARPLSALDSPSPSPSSSSPHLPSTSRRHERSSR